MRHARAASLGLVGLIAILSAMADWTVDATSEFKRYVVIGRDDCEHDVTGVPVTLHRAPKDRIKWTLDNSCPADTKVLLCVYRDNIVNNPFDACSGDGNIGKPVTVPKRNGHRTLTCKVKRGATDSPPDYLKQVLVGAEIPANDQCPDHPISEFHHHGKRQKYTQMDPMVQATHILDVDVQP